MLAQRRDRCRVQCDGATRPGALGRAERRTASRGEQLLLDRQPCTVAIDRPPCQPEQLTSPRSRGRGETPQTPEAHSVRDRKETPELPGCPCAGAPSRLAGRVGEPSDVARNAPPPVRGGD